MCAVAKANSKFFFKCPQMVRKSVKRGTINLDLKTGDVAQLVESLPRMYEALGPFFSLYKSGHGSIYL